MSASATTTIAMTEPPTEQVRIQLSTRERDFDLPEKTGPILVATSPHSLP